MSSLVNPASTRSRNQITRTVNDVLFRKFLLSMIVSSLKPSDHIAGLRLFFCSSLMVLACGSL